MAELSGSNQTVNLDGDHETAMLSGSNSTVALNGSFDSAILSDSNQTAILNGSNESVSLNSTNDLVSLDGQNDSLEGSNATIDIGPNVNAAVSGSLNTLVFQPESGLETITGFDPTDTIQLGNSEFANWSDLLGNISQSGSDTVIKIDAANAITLKGVTATSLQASQFKFS